MKEIADSDGETKSVVGYDKFETLDLDVFPSGATPGTVPDQFDVVTVGGSVAYLCLGAEEQSTNEGEQKISMRLKRYPNNITLT